MYILYSNHTHLAKVCGTTALWKKKWENYDIRNLVKLAWFRGKLTMIIYCYSTERTQIFHSPWCGIWINYHGYYIVKNFTNTLGKKIYAVCHISYLFLKCGNSAGGAAKFEEKCGVHICSTTGIMYKYK